MKDFPKIGDVFILETRIFSAKCVYLGYVDQPFCHEGVDLIFNCKSKAFEFKDPMMSDHEFEIIDRSKDREELIKGNLSAVLDQIGKCYSL